MNPKVSAKTVARRAAARTWCGLRSGRAIRVAHLPPHRYQHIPLAQNTREICAPRIQIAYRSCVGRAPNALLEVRDFASVKAAIAWWMAAVAYLRGSPA